MQSLLSIAPGLILEGRRERLGATRLAPGLIHKFAAFTGSWLVKPGSRSFSRGEFEKCDPPSARRVALFSEGQVFLLFSDGLEEISMETGLFGRSCDPPSARRVAILRLGSEGRKSQKNKSSQNEVLYSGKCSHARCHHF